MSNEIQKSQPNLDSVLDRTTLFQVVTSGDTSAMTVDQKLQYYKVMCEASGLDPRLVPFQFIKTSEGERLYATKGATNQLGFNHKVSCKLTKQEVMMGIMITSVIASTPDGRETPEIGAVSIEGLSGKALANSFMTSMTKAKRRAVLSHCGLGVLDETEADGVQGTYVPPMAQTEAPKQSTVTAAEVVQPAAAAPQPAPTTVAEAKKAATKKKSDPPPAQPAADVVQPAVQTSAASAPVVQPALQLTSSPAVATTVPQPSQSAPPVATTSPAATGGKKPTRSERLNGVCSKAGTSPNNGLAFLKRVLGSDLQNTEPVKVEGAIRALEAFAGSEEKRAVQALINNETPTWIDEAAWRIICDKYVQLFAHEVKELSAKVGAKA